MWLLARAWAARYNPAVLSRPRIAPTSASLRKPSLETHAFKPLKADYDRQGWVIVRNLLSAADLAELESNLARFIRDVVPNLPDSQAFYDERGRPETLRQLHGINVDPFFDAYRQHPVWCDLAETLVGGPAEANEPEWFNKPPGFCHATPPHQDNYYFCLQPPNVVTIWLALDDIDEDNGCLRYRSGSHLEGIRPHAASGILGFSQGITDYGPQDSELEAPACLRRGDAVAHHGNTIHRADANASPSRQRRSFALVFRGQSCRRDEAAYSRYLASVKKQQSALGVGHA